MMDIKQLEKRAIAHERQLKPVQADVSKNAMDDLIRRGDVLGALHDCRNILAMKNDVNAKTIGAVINTIPAISNTVEAVYQYRHVNENGGWIDCDINGYIKAKNWFECEVRELFTAPAQSQSVKEALEAASQVLDDWIKSSTDYGFTGDADNYKTIQAEIRALIQDEKES